MAKVNYYKKIDLSDKKVADLEKLLRELREELRNARANRAAGNNHRIRDLRRNIARVLTKLNEIGNK